MVRKIYGVHLNLPVMAQEPPAGVGFDYVEVGITTGSGARYEITLSQLTALLESSGIEPIFDSPTPQEPEAEVEAEPVDAEEETIED